MQAACHPSAVLPEPVGTAEAGAIEQPSSKCYTFNPVAGAARIHVIACMRKMQTDALPVLNIKGTMLQ